MGDVSLAEPTGGALGLSFNGNYYTCRLIRIGRRSSSRTSSNNPKNEAVYRVRTCPQNSPPSTSRYLITDLVMGLKFDREGRPSIDKVEMKRSGDAGIDLQHIEALQKLVEGVKSESLPSIRVPAGYIIQTTE